MSELLGLDGINDEHVEQLQGAGVSSLVDLLDPQVIKEVAETTSLSSKLIFNWVDQANLITLNNISTKQADLLELAGIDTVSGLAQQSPDNLHAKMSNEIKKRFLAREIPIHSDVESWISTAGSFASSKHKSLPGNFKYFRDK